MPVNKKIIIWLPRIISLAFVLFLSLFSLDVVGQTSGWGLALAFFMHLLPVFFLALIAAVAWKYDLVGATAFLAFAAYYIFSVGFDRHWSWYVSISGPAAIVGILYLLSWREKRKPA